jgi:hypothetical protein
MYNMNTHAGQGFIGERSVRQSRLATKYSPPQRTALVIAAFFFLGLSLSTLASSYFILFPPPDAAAHRSTAPTKRGPQVPEANLQTTVAHELHAKAGQKSASHSTNTSDGATSPAQVRSTPSETSLPNKFQIALIVAVWLAIDSILGWITVRLYRSWRKKSQIWNSRFICLKCEQLFVP